MCIVSSNGYNQLDHALFMENKPLISVIVPIYNVEQYLIRCVDSIRDQTYKNLEIILVDDGSPDNCGSMCDEFAKVDSRIKVVHRKNGGLSAARNSGTEICKGEYLAFVDSDDCIHPKMYENLYNCITKYNTRLAFCQPTMVYDDVILELSLTAPVQLHDKEFVIRTCMQKQQWWAVWTKLYHRSLIPYLQFPEGRTNEDYAVMMYLYDQCDKIVIDYNKYYYYCIRPNSITTSKLNIKKFDILINAREVYEYMLEKHSEWAMEAHALLATHELSLFSQSYSNEFFKAQNEKILKNIRKEIGIILRNPYVIGKQRLLLLLIAIHPSLYIGFSKMIDLFKQ